MRHAGPTITAFDLQGWPRPSRSQLQALLDHARPLAAEDPLLAEGRGAWLAGSIAIDGAPADATLSVEGVLVLTAADGTTRTLRADRLSDAPGGRFHFYAIEATFDGAPLTITWQPTYTDIGSLEQQGPSISYADPDYVAPPRPPVAFSPRPAGIVAWWVEPPTIDLAPKRDGRAGRLAITIRLVDDDETLAIWAQKAHLSPAQARATLRHLLPPIPPADPVELAVLVDATEATLAPTRRWMASRSGELIEGEPVPPPDVRRLRVGEAVRIERDLGAGVAQVDVIGDVLTARFVY